MGHVIHMEDIGQLSDVGTPSTVGLQSHTASALTHWAISPAPSPNYYRIQEKSMKPVLLSMFAHARITSQDTTHFPTWSVVVLWIRMAPIGPYVWIFGPQLVELFGNDWEVWPWWRRCVTRVQAPIPSAPSLSPHTLSSKCKLSVVLDALTLLPSWTQSHQNCENKLNILFYKLPWSLWLITVIEK